MNEERFSEARALVLSEAGAESGIGRLSEKTLHKTLKYYIEPNEENHEVPFLGSVADIKNGQGIFEIQTRSAVKLKPKLKKFLPKLPVTVVFPLAVRKTVSWVSVSGDISSPRVSPKSESVYDAFFELSALSEFFFQDGFSLKLLLLDVSEYRRLNKNGGKRGSVRMERIPNRLLAEYDVKSRAELAELLDFALGEEFTAKDVQKKSKRAGMRLYYILRFLMETGVISRVGKKGNAYIYKRIV